MDGWDMGDMGKGPCYPPSWKGPGGKNPSKGRKRMVPYL